MNIYNLLLYTHKLHSNKPIPHKERELSKNNVVRISIKMFTPTKNRIQPQGMDHGITHSLIQDTNVL